MDKVQKFALCYIGLALVAFVVLVLNACYIAALLPVLMVGSFSMKSHTDDRDSEDDLIVSDKN